MEEATYKKIEFFLSGEMPKEEAIEFEKKLQENDELKSEVALYRAINSHISENDEEIDVDSDYKKELLTYIKSDEGKSAEKKLLKIRKEYHDKEEETKPSKPKGKLVYFIVSTAAIIAFVIGVFIYQNQETNQELYARYYSVNELPSFADRSGDEYATLILAVEKFNTTDYTSSLSNFNSYLTESTNINPLTYIYIGIIQSEMGNLNKSIEQFDILGNLPIEDSSRALWYKALVYLKFDKEQKAKETLRLIIEKESNYKYKEAVELYKEL